MAGYAKLYVFGGQGGFLGSDGVNPIEFLVFVGDADRQWLEAQYVDKSIRPIGDVRVIIPQAPDEADALLDACIAFCPQKFRSCPSLAEVEAGLAGVKRLDFHAEPASIPSGWSRLREEARPIFAGLCVWEADLKPLERP